MSERTPKTGHFRRNRRPWKGSRARSSAQAPLQVPAEQPSLFEDLECVPCIIPRPEHRISRKDIDREVLKVLYRLKDSGYIAYLVGGSVRDLLLGKRPKDFDIGTNARPEEVRKLFKYSRVIGRRFRLVHVYFRGGKAIEVSTFRRRAEYDDQEAEREGLDVANMFGSPQEDAFRRDLTINGLFYNIADFSVIDYVGGMDDLQAGVIRTIGDPGRRFLRDPVRMMRAVRHAARIDFVIEPATWEAIVAHRDKIRLCAVPRVRDEWLKDVRSGSAVPWARLMMESGLFSCVFPGYASSLAGKDRVRVRDLLLGLLERLDGIHLGGQEPAEGFLLALFVYSPICFSSAWKELESERIRWPTAEVRSLIDDLIAPYDFSRAVRDRAAQLLAGQWPIAYCAANGIWPKRVWNKSAFDDSVAIYDLVRECQGLPPIGPAPHRRQAAGPRDGARRRERASGPESKAAETILVRGGSWRPEETES